MAREQLGERISAPALFVQFSKAINWKEESLLGQNGLFMAAPYC